MPHKKLSVVIMSDCEHIPDLNLSEVLCILAEQNPKDFAALAIKMQVCEFENELKHEAEPLSIKVNVKIMPDKSAVVTLHQSAKKPVYLPLQLIRENQSEEKEQTH